MSHHVSGFQSFVMLIARVCLSLIFVVAGAMKIMQFDHYQALMIAQGVPHAEILLIVAIVFELGGSLLVFFGLFARFGAFILFLFVLPVTYFFHGFWGMEGAEMVNQVHHFLKNLSILGGLLYVLAVGPGKFSVDGLRCHGEERVERGGE